VVDRSHPAGPPIPLTAGAGRRAVIAIAAECRDLRFGEKLNPDEQQIARPMWAS